MLTKCAEIYIHDDLNRLEALSYVLRDYYAEFIEWYILFRGVVKGGTKKAPIPLLLLNGVLGPDRVIVYQFFWKQCTGRG